MANSGTTSGGVARTLKVLERREGHWGPSQIVEADFEAFYTEYHFPRGTHFCFPSDEETLYTRGDVLL